MDIDLLKYIVENSKVQIGPQHPHGWCYVAGNTDCTELVTNELVQANVTQRAADGSYPVRPTEAGVKLANEPKQSTAQPVPLASKPDPASINIEYGIAIPEKKAFGRTSDGNDNVTKFKFHEMEINGSFFIPQPANVETPIHRTFSSVVSQANKKLWPKNFVIRQWEGGARVWRVENLKEQRPTRKPKADKAPQPVTQAGPQFPGGFAAPGHSEFGAGQGFGAPQPFAGPQGFGEQTWAEPETDLPQFGE